MTSGLEVLEHNLHGPVPAGSARYAHVQLRNAGEQVWSIDSDAGVTLRADHCVIGSVRLHHDVAPGATTTLSFGWRAPSRPGAVSLSLEQGLGGQGSVFWTASMELGAPAPDHTEQQLATMFEHGVWHWLPAGGVRLGARGARYPNLVAHAKGARCTDADGREFVDWVMGWGSCLLGYGEPHVAAAVIESLQSTSLTTLPSLTEVRLSQALCQRFPGAEMVAYGKNGSDACTAAVRLARAFTGREVILHSGYHGWHDWYVDRRGLAACGVPTRIPGVVHRFADQDLPSLDRLLAEHHGCVAAVMVEPAAQLQSLDGPVLPAHAEYLQGLAERCRRAGALLVFDEIFTAFRHPAGSVQQWADVQPDLTCLGKALTNGMPLSAVLGRRDVFLAAMDRIAFDATYKGEPHALAAAIAALQQYAKLDVAKHVAKVARELTLGIKASAARHGLEVRVTGEPLRLLPVFVDDSSPVLLRTLLQQELLAQGVVTFRGVLLPSLAHGPAELRQTLAAYDHAFANVREARATGQILRRLEIPLVQ